MPISDQNNNKNVSFDISKETSGKLELGSGVSLEMIWCPPGIFWMGKAPHEKPTFYESTEVPQREVSLTQGYWIAATPITYRQLQVINSINIPENHDSLDSPAKLFLWQEAMQICHQLNLHIMNKIPNLYQAGGFFSLPTEAQWEYACRAGTKSIWYFGDDELQLSSHAWYGYKDSVTLPSVKLKKPNPWGLYDLYGLVYEWCLDVGINYAVIKDYRVDPVIDENNPVVLQINEQLKALKSKIITRAVRGGRMFDSAENCRSSSRSAIPETNDYNELTGMRVVLNKAVKN